MTDLKGPENLSQLNKSTLHNLMIESTKQGRTAIKLELEQQNEC